MASSQENIEKFHPDSHHKFSKSRKLSVSALEKQPHKGNWTMVGDEKPTLYSTCLLNGCTQILYSTEGPEMLKKYFRF